MHVLVMLIREKTSLHVAGNMAIRAALELIQHRGYVITPPKPNAPCRTMPEKEKPQAFSLCGSPGSNCSVIKRRCSPGAQSIAQTC